MLIALIVLSTCVQIAATLLILGFFVRGAKKIGRQAIDSANAELGHLVAGEPCQSASVLNAIARSVGSEAGRSMKASLMAELSHAQRAINADAEDAAVDAIGEQHPGIGNALAIMPGKTRRQLAKNPFAQLALQFALGGGLKGLMGGQDISGGGNGGGPNPSVRDRLKGM